MKGYNVFFKSVQVNTEPFILKSEARNFLRKIHKGAVRKYNYDTDYIAEINLVEITGAISAFDKNRRT